MKHYTLYHKDQKLKSLYKSFYDYLAPLLWGGSLANFAMCLITQQRRCREFSHNSLSQAPRTKNSNLSLQSTLKIKQEILVFSLLLFFFFFFIFLERISSFLYNWGRGCQKYQGFPADSFVQLCKLEKLKLESPLYPQSQLAFSEAQDLARWHRMAV